MYYFQVGYAYRIILALRFDSMRYKVERVIYEIVQKKPYPTIREIDVTLQSTDLIAAGIQPDERDNEDELYGDYELTLDQLTKIQELMKTDFNIDFAKYLYVLGCYQTE